MNKKIFFLGAALLAVTTFASAEPKTNGFYLGGNLGFANVNEKVVDINSFDVSKNTGGFGWNANAGYLFNKCFATEVIFLGYPNESFDPLAKGESNYAAALAAVGILPFDNGFSFFGKLGIAAVHHKLVAINGSSLIDGDVNHAAAALFGCVGIGYAITDNVGMNIGANITSKNGNIPSMSQATIGLSYMF